MPDEQAGRVSYLSTIGLYSNQIILSEKSE
jgi:hypothetical protein